MMYALRTALWFVLPWLVRPYTIIVTKDITDGHHDEVFVAHRTFATWADEQGPCVHRIAVRYYRAFGLLAAWRTFLAERREWRDDLYVSVDRPRANLDTLCMITPIPHPSPAQLSGLLRARR